MTADRAEWHLWNWANWMHGGLSGHLRIAPSSSSAAQVDNADFDRMVTEADDRCAKATDSAIDGLTPTEKAAVYAKHLRGQWAASQTVLDAYYTLARLQVGRTLERKGIA